MHQRNKVLEVIAIYLEEKEHDLHSAKEFDDACERCVEEARKLLRVRGASLQRAS